MEELQLDLTRLSDSGMRIVTRAEDEARRRSHDLLTSEHLFIAFAQAEWNTYARVMRDVSVRPDDLLTAVEHALETVPTRSSHLVRMTELAQELVRRAITQAATLGREHADACDIFVSLLFERRSGPSMLLRRFGTDGQTVGTRVMTLVQDVELRDEKLRRRYELPPVLRQYAVNLNLLARQDALPPVFGRDRELARVIEILSHKERANSVMLVGEPGVGKTAVVEALARRLELEPKTVPTPLRDCQVVSLQLHSLVAGTMLRGMFEDRIQNVLREIRERPNLLIFVDEAHTMVGAGSALGAPSDAAAMFKGVLARGEVRMIGATTFSEYKQHVAEDEALARRFRLVTVPEPSPAETREILNRLRPRLERNYAVRLLDEALDAAIRLAPRYQRHLRLPDKAIAWLDTAAVRVEIARGHEVTAADVTEVVANDSQLPLESVTRRPGQQLDALGQHLTTRIVGQREAITRLTERLALNRGPLKDGFDRPDGVLLFLGPTGVGKTELAKALAEFLFGDSRKMIRLDMSEFQDSATAIDKVIGSARGVAGSERGGVLVNALRDNPYSVVLLDEIEKATPALLNLFLQAFDEGWITDGRGRRVYLSDAVIIMTSNIGAEHFRRLEAPLGFARADHTQSVRADVLRELERRLSPEFRNRIDDIIVFQPLAEAEVADITRLELERLVATAADQGKHVEIGPGVVDVLARAGYSAAYGARYLKRTIDEQVKIPLSLAWSTASGFAVSVKDGHVVLAPEDHPLSQKPSAG